MECPPQKEFIAARERLAQGAKAMHPATLILHGVEVSGASSIGPETFALGERGAQKIQSVSAVVAKALYPDAPTQGQILKVGGLAFKLVEVQGHDPVNTDWYLRGSRTPGSDAVAG